MSGKRPSPKLLVPLAILGVGVVGVVLLVATREVPETRKPPEVAPLVRVVEVRPQDWQYVVRSQGTVAPRTQSDLIAQVVLDADFDDDGLLDEEEVFGLGPGLQLDPRLLDTDGDGLTDGQELGRTAPIPGGLSDGLAIPFVGSDPPWP